MPLAPRDEIVGLNKIDTIDEEHFAIMSQIQIESLEVFTLSAATGKNTKELVELLGKRVFIEPNKDGFFRRQLRSFHYGHLNSILSVAEALELDQVRVVSGFDLAAQNSDPKLHSRAATRNAEASVVGHEDLITIDTREIKRGGVSYTIDTIESFIKEIDADVTLIIGMDQFFKFDQWKNFDKLLSLVDLAVTTRPGMELPYSLDEWPLGLRNLVGDADSKQAMLKTGRTIHFVCASKTSRPRAPRFGAKFASSKMCKLW